MASVASTRGGVLGGEFALTTNSYGALAEWLSGDPDVLRRGGVRLFGYCNEVGEALRPIVCRRIVAASYGITGAYVCMDASWRGLQARNCVNGPSPLAELADSLAWQGLASIVVSGAIINRIVWACKKALPPASRLPTLVGLACIPFIVHPVDEGVHMLLNRTIRPLYMPSGSKQEEQDE
mmetsp:Transcript_51304/g.94838  ORF Transcript_51304/g.94838 Transcript_51304/m.94838 type:complete len:180 (-) Transcript_51304:5-544(-)